MIGSITVLPAVLSMMGDKIDKGRIPLIGRLKRRTAEFGLWSRVVDRVRGREVAKRKPVPEPGAASLYQQVSFRQDTAYLSVGERTNTNVSFSGTDPNGPDGRAGSGIAKMTYSATKDTVKGGAVIASTDVTGASASTLLTTEGLTTFHYHATDVAENVGILRAIARGAARTDDDARSIRSPSYVKWSLLAALWSTLAFVPASLVATFAGRLSIGLPYAVAAVVCIVGLILSSPWLVGMTAGPIAVALIAQLVVFLR